MARPKEFDQEQALDAVIGVFREHGFEGTSTEMLVRAAGIGRQSLYDTFGDKWELYCSSLRRYVTAETRAHAEALQGGVRAIDGIGAMLERVVADADQACLGVNSVCEFGRTRKELKEIHDAVGRTLRATIARRVKEAQAGGHVARNLDPEEVAEFLIASIAGIRIAARGGARAGHLRALAQLALRALR
jgi:TetR/AcrR family transcriptional regulator, transcriptional repressor for nem operon